MKNRFKGFLLVFAFVAAAVGMMPKQANAWCIYNNTKGHDIYAVVYFLTLSGVQRDMYGDALPGGEYCRQAKDALFTWKIGIMNGAVPMEFCEMPFSTNATTVTVIDDPNEPIGFRCCRDCGPGWKG